MRLKKTVKPLSLIVSLVNGRRSVRSERSGAWQRTGCRNRGCRAGTDGGERGAKLFASNCAGCHGVAARGSAAPPDLVRSILVLDDERGFSSRLSSAMEDRISGCPNLLFPMLRLPILSRGYMFRPGPPATVRTMLLRMSLPGMPGKVKRTSNNAVQRAIPRQAI